jgi:hypothetical protein
MPPSCLRPAASSSAAALLQQCLTAVELPDASAIAVPQLKSSFDCCAEAQPLAAAAHAGAAAAEQAALTTWVCSEPADVWRHCTAAHTAVLEVPAFMPLAVATAAPRMHDIRVAISAADPEVAQLLGDISLQVWLLHCAGHIDLKCCKRYASERSSDASRHLTIQCSQCHGWRTAGTPLMTTSFSATCYLRSGLTCCLWSAWTPMLLMPHQIRCLPASFSHHVPVHMYGIDTHACSYAAFHNVGGVPATFGSPRLGLHMCGSGHPDHQCRERRTEAGLVPHCHASKARR